MTVLVSSQPGPIICDLWMEARSEAEVAPGLGIPEAELAACLDGRTDVTPRLDLHLMQIDRSNAAYWMRPLAAYDLVQEHLRRTAPA